MSDAEWVRLFWGRLKAAKVRLVDNVNSAKIFTATTDSTNTSTSATDPTSTSTTVVPVGTYSDLLT